MSKRKGILEACSEGNIKLVTEIINKRKKTDIRDNHNWTALHHAVKARSIECVQLLLQKTNIDPRAECNEGQTALMWACMDTDIPIDIVEALLNHDPELVEFMDNEFVSPLHKATSKRRLDIVQSLIKHGADPSYQDLDGDTALHIAAINANYEILEYLLYDTTCDPTICNYEDLNCVDLIINLQQHRIFPDLNHSFECLKLLIDFIYDTEDYPNNGVPELLLSVQDTDILNFIIDKFLTENNSQSYFLDVLKNSTCYFPSVFSFFHDNVRSVNDFDEVPQVNLLNLQFMISIDSLNHYFQLCYEILSKGVELRLTHESDELVDVINFVQHKFSVKEQRELFKFFNLFGIAAHDIRDFILERFHIIDPEILNSALRVLNPLSIRSSVPQSINILRHIYDNTHSNCESLVETFIPAYENNWTILRKFAHEKNINFVPSLKYLSIFEYRKYLFRRYDKYTNAIQLDVIDRLPVANVIKDLILYRINAL